MVRFEYKHFAFLGAESILAAEAAECANEQGQFWPYHDTIFANQSGENQGSFSRDALKNFAAALGLNQEEFNECLDSGEYRSVVDAEIAEAESRDVNSTPTLFVNGEKIEGAASFTALQNRIQAELNQAQ